MSLKEIIILPGVEEMSEYLTAMIREKLDATSAGNFLHAALSGGSTPKQIFEHIVIRSKECIQWERIRFFQVDERCVPPDSAESNFRMIYLHLLTGVNFPEEGFFRIKGENDPQEEAGRYGNVLAENLPMVENWPVFDMVLLGLGEDGHTASLFPGNTAIANSLNYSEVAVHPQSGQKRITLTLPVINRAKHVVFLVTGQIKSAMVKEIIQYPEIHKYPASYVQPGNGTLTWLIDSEAASTLT